VYAGKNLADCDMVRKRGKMALYEVISGGRLKSAYDKTLQHMRPEGTGDESADGSRTYEKFCWPTKPRMFQINAGRIEISVPYQLAVAVLLGIILLILIAFRLGQRNLTAAGPVADLPKSAQGKAGPVVSEPESVDTVRKIPPRKISPGIKKFVPIKLTGSNHIVIKEYARKPDLEQAEKYFDSLGIETEIVKSGNRYFLRTVNTYENPGRQGTDGYIALKQTGHRRVSKLLEQNLFKMRTAKNLWVSN
jgi:hypothetical protein